MLDRSAIGMLALAAALATFVSSAKAFDDATYPDWSGSWLGIGGGSFDTSKPKGLGQQAPLKPESQKILERSIADIAAGGQGNDPGYHCGSHGMPRVMIANVPIYFVILPATTYVILERLSQVRRIFTDARGGPARLPGASVRTIVPYMRGYIGRQSDPSSLRSHERASRARFWSRSPRLVQPSADL